MGKAIGIDLGTTNSVVAYKDNMVRVIGTGPNTEDLCRSCVAIDMSGSLVVGNEAYKNWRRYAPNIAVSVKRLMGASISDEQVQMMKKDSDVYPYGISKLHGGTDDSLALMLKGEEYTPEQISAYILRQLKDDASIKLGGEVTHAVITVPAYFNEKQKSATRRAAEMAGLKVQRLLAEPTAAAISYVSDMMKDNDDRIFLVYDFGGGTFDLSILVASGNNFIESGCGGDRWLGGDDIDRLIAEYVLAKAGREFGIDMHEYIDELPERKRYAFWGDFKYEIECAKKALSHVNVVTISLYDRLQTPDGQPLDIEVKLTREEFEQMIRPLIQRTIELIDNLLDNSGYPIESIDNILLVGGTACIPLIRKMLGEKYGKEKILVSEKPMLAVAEGAAILAHDLGMSYECPNCGHHLDIMDEECPYCHASVSNDHDEEPVIDSTHIVYTTKHQYFIEVKDDDGNVSYPMIIDRGKVMPRSAYRKFYTTVENQKIIGVKLYSDAENGNLDKIGTGYFTIKENLPARSELQFTFRLTEDEIMEVWARVVSTGHTHSINYSRGKLDTHCYDVLQTSFDTVILDPNISDVKKKDFIAKLQCIIEDTERTPMAPNYHGWQDIEREIVKATEIATAKESADNINFTIAKVLLNYFGKFLTKDHKEALMRGIAEYEQAKNESQKQIRATQLELINEKYSMYVSAFLLIIAGHYESDPVKANRALSAYEKFMEVANKGYMQRAKDILDENEDLITGVKLPTITSSTDIAETRMI